MITPEQRHAARHITEALRPLVVDRDGIGGSDGATPGRGFCPVWSSSHSAYCALPQGHNAYDEHLYTRGGSDKATPEDSSHPFHSLCSCADCTSLRGLRRPDAANSWFNAVIDMTNRLMLVTPRTDEEIQVLTMMRRELIRALGRRGRESKSPSR